VTPESRPDEARDASEIPMLIAGFAIGVGIGAALLAVAWLILEAVGA
jgi:hypothetical protein